MRPDPVRELTRRNAELKGQVGDLMRALAQVGAVSQLTAGVVHDVRNALQVMLSEAETLLRNLREPRQRETADYLIRAGQHAADVSNDLLVLSRRQRASPVPVNSAELVSSFRRVIQQVTTRRHQCLFDVDPDSWWIEVERAQLEAALINLSANARDAMPKGGQVRITTRNLPRGTNLPSMLPPGDYVSLSVEDTGQGMSPSVLARATEPFFTTKPAERGTGLGLATAESFARRSGGALQIASELDQGTRVEILLPRAKLPAQPRDAAHAEQLVKLRRIQRRVRSAFLNCVLDRWAVVCPPDRLPPPSTVEAMVAERADSAIVFGVDLAAMPPALRLIRMGDALVSALAGGVIDELALDGSVTIGSLGAAYRRALRSRFPSYEYVRYAFGAMPPGEFERLILPAAQDGQRVTHLIGVILLSSGLTLGGAA